MKLHMIKIRELSLCIHNYCEYEGETQFEFSVMEKKENLTKEFIKDYLIDKEIIDFTAFACDYNNQDIEAEFEVDEFEFEVVEYQRRDKKLFDQYCNEVVKLFDQKEDRCFEKKNRFFEKRLALIRELKINSGEEEKIISTLFRVIEDLTLFLHLSNMSRNKLYQTIRTLGFLII